MAESPKAVPDSGHIAPDGNDRTIRRERRLPGGRAVVGALLIATAAVTVFATYLNASAPPTTRFLAASVDVAPGTFIADLSVAEQLFHLVPLELVEEVGRRAFEGHQLDRIVGRVFVAPLSQGELLQQSSVANPGVQPQAHAMSLSLPRAHALGGDLVVGERVDVFSTSTVNGRSMTELVVAHAQVLALDRATSTAGGSVLLIAGLASREEIVAVGHAANTGVLFLARPAITAEQPDHRASGGGSGSLRGFYGGGR